MDAMAALASSEVSRGAGLRASESALSRDIRGPQRGRPVRASVCGRSTGLTVLAIAYSDINTVVPIKPRKLDRWPERHIDLGIGSCEVRKPRQQPSRGEAMEGTYGYARPRSGDKSCSGTFIELIERVRDRQQPMPNTGEQNLTIVGQNHPLALANEEPGAQGRF